MLEVWTNEKADYVETHIKTTTNDIKEIHIQQPNDDELLFVPDVGERLVVKFNSPIYETRIMLTARKTAKAITYMKIYAYTNPTALGLISTREPGTSLPVNTIKEGQFVNWEDANGDFPARLQATKDFKLHDLEMVYTDEEPFPSGADFLVWLVHHNYLRHHNVFDIMVTEK